MIDKPLHIKYRPQDWDEVVGQDAVVASLSKIVQRNSNRTFLFSGPSGCGKTTLARIAAAKFGCDGNLVEIDAATHTGVDDMRKVAEMAHLMPLGGKTAQRAIIIDESHRLSRNAMDSLLKIVEEPPPHLRWFFCTTEPEKMPPTMKTRSIYFQLKSVNNDDLHSLIEAVCKEENIKLKQGVATLIVREAGGSPRQALINLAVCRDADSSRTAADLLRTVLDGDAVLELCRFIAKGGGSWPAAMQIMGKLEKENPEGIRIQVSNYLGAAILAAKSDKAAIFFLSKLEAFCTPFNQSEGKAPLMLAIGRTLFSGEDN